MKIELAFIAIFLALLPSPAPAREAREQGRIEFLLHEVGTAKGVTFIRNGANYEGEAAAKHLRRKLDYAGERLHTAEEFIQFCATESSFTHRKYLVRLPDGTTEEAAVYFSGLLKEFDHAQR